MLSRTWKKATFIPRYRTGSPNIGLPRKENELNGCAHFDDFTHTHMNETELQTANNINVTENSSTLVVTFRIRVETPRSEPVVQSSPKVVRHDMIID